jgi:glycosyltransferase involved in cell wall biosynthesis
MFLRSVDAVVTPGIAATEAVRAAGVPDERIRTGFNAVDVARFAARAASARVTAAAGEAGHRFLFVGRLVPLKRLDLLLQAFRDVAKPHDTLTIVGRGPCRDELAATADALGIADAVRFLDELPNDAIPVVMGEADTLVLPSDQEVWGLVVNEALAAGLHVVVSDRCGVAPSVAHMRGVFVTEADAGWLGAAMAMSRDAWTGPVQQPAILAETPASFAAVFGRTIGAVLAGAARRPRWAWRGGRSRGSASSR